MIKKNFLKKWASMVLSVAMIFTCSLSFANASNVPTDASGIGSGEDIIGAPVIHEEVIFDDGSPDPEKTRAKYTAKTPFYGTSRDYTKKQNVKNGTLKGDRKIRKYTVNGLALLMAVVSGNLAFLDAADAIIKLCDSSNNNTKNLYYTKTRYGHKKMPGVYHKYIIKWYTNKAKTKYAKTTIYYDSTQ